MRRTRFDEWPCPIARTADLIGDWWTPLVMREAFSGVRRFGDFAERLDIPRAVLTARLNRLVDEGMLDRVEYQSNPPRHEYRLTDKGRDFWNVLAAMWRWGSDWLWDSDEPPVILRHIESGEEIRPIVVDESTGLPLDVAADAHRPEPSIEAATAVAEGSDALRYDPDVAPVELSQSDIDIFRRDGYLLVESVFADTELEAFRDASDRILELSIDSTIALGRRHPRLDAKLHDDGRVTVRKIQPINDLDDRLAAIATDERLLGPLRQLMGDEPILMEEKLNPKHTVDTRGLDLSVLAGSSFNREIGMEGFHLHHDWGYYRQQGYPENTLSSAVAIDTCADRGPLRVIPGSHLVDAPLVDDDPSSGSGVVVDGFFSTDDLVPLDVPAGSVMLFHAKLVHDSEPNRSGLPRRVMIYSHYPRSHDPAGDPDRRNGPVRTYSREFEQRYRDLVAAGEYEPAFHLP